jgi:hypothetical protein
VLTVMGGIFFCAIIFHAMDRVTVHSYWSSLSDLNSIPPAAALRLSSAGIRTPRDLLARIFSRPQREALANMIGVPSEELECWTKAAEFAELKGMGAPNANLLMSAGIQDMAGLARQDPVQLHENLLRYYRNAPGKPLPPPRPAVLRIWVREAQKRTTGR